MVKLIFFCRRRTDITRERYAELLLEGHVPLALVHHPTLRAYIVNLVDRAQEAAPPMDSIGELFFDSLEDYRTRLYDSDEGRRTIERDVAGFLGSAWAYATTEHVQKSTRPEPALHTRTPGVKMVCPVRRRSDMTHAEFVEHWLGTHVPLALRHHPGLNRYVTNVVDARLSAAGEEWDGVAELHFASAEDLSHRLFVSAEGERVIREDMAKFIGETFAYFVGEYGQRR